MFGDRSANKSTVNCIWLSLPFWCVSCGVPAFDFHGRAGVFMMALSVDEEGPWCNGPSREKCFELDMPNSKRSELHFTCMAVVVSLLWSCFLDVPPTGHS